MSSPQGDLGQPAQTATTPPESAVRIGLASGRSIACTVAGAGPALFLLHGIGGARAQWAPQIAALGTANTVIAWDARGYGDSDGPPVNRFSDFADDLFALMDRLAIEQAVAVGHSMGGRILLEACAHQPNRFAGLVLSGTQPAYLMHMTAAERADYIGQRRTLFDGERVRPEKVAAIVNGLLHPQASAQAKATMTKSLSGLRRDGYLAALEASGTMDRRSVLSTLAMPVRVLGGDTDAVCPVAVTQDLAHAIGQGPATILPKVGHMPNLEAPEAFSAVVTDLLAALPKPADTPDRPHPNAP